MSIKENFEWKTKEKYFHKSGMSMEPAKLFLCLYMGLGNMLVVITMSPNFSINIKSQSMDLIIAVMAKVPVKGDILDPINFLFLILKP